MRPTHGLLVLFWLLPQALPGQPDLGARYVEAWKAFHPSRALAKGMHEAIFTYEDLHEEKLNQWIEFNHLALVELSDSATVYRSEQPINARLLATQIRSELERWSADEPHRTSAGLYTRLIRDAPASVSQATFLTEDEKQALYLSRMQAMRALCQAAWTNLQVSRITQVKGGLNDLADARKSLLNLKGQGAESGVSPALALQAEEVLQSIDTLRRFLTRAANQMPESDEKAPLGRNKYAQLLELYTDTKLTPEALAAMAYEEIEVAKARMAEVALSYLRGQARTAPGQDPAEAVRIALADMERDAPSDGAEYLAFWQRLSEAAEQFVREKDLATVPKDQTLSIESAPESAGAAARIGWVSSAPPFAPNPWTTLYVPSIPDTLPAQEQRDFWASFNKPFNRFIVIHELFPGHYMQNKISRDSPHEIRLLFPYGPYSEGWATFCEKVALDAGWQAGNQLTLLAHLRKRLENANRAYTSVKVHCDGWSEDQVMQFSTESAWLAPQFAKSLWGRLMRSPMQMTSYFWGGRQFRQLLQDQQDQHGADFLLKSFMDTILRAGPIPIDSFYTLLEKTH